jgi:hypothetical protein
METLILQIRSMILQNSLPMFSDIANLQINE